MFLVLHHKMPGYLKYIPAKNLPYVSNQKYSLNSIPPLVHFAHSSDTAPEVLCPSPWTVSPIDQHPIATAQVGIRQ